MPRLDSRQAGGKHLVKASSDGLVEAVRQVGGAQHQHPRLVAVDTLHLDQELGLDPPRCLALALAARAAQRIDLRSMLRSRHVPTVSVGQPVSYDM